jgi:hypothetical protein
MQLQAILSTHPKAHGDADEVGVRRPRHASIALRRASPAPMRVLPRKVWINYASVFA